jgi:SPX domain protein involved in polyphosphate accumulation
VHKILKKHDKLLPHSPCRQFYIAHLHQQPWVQGTYSDVLVHLSNVYSQLRGDQTGQKNEDAAQVGCNRLLQFQAFFGCRRYQQVCGRLWL